MPDLRVYGLRELLRREKAFCASCIAREPIGLTIRATIEVDETTETAQTINAAAAIRAIEASAAARIGEATLAVLGVLATLATLAAITNAAIKSDEPTRTARMRLRG